jgi:hypothetical protein
MVAANRVVAQRLEKGRSDEARNGATRPGRGGRSWGWQLRQANEGGKVNHACQAKVLAKRQGVKMAENAKQTRKAHSPVPICAGRGSTSSLALAAITLGGAKAELLGLEKGIKAPYSSNEVPGDAEEADA